MSAQTQPYSMDGAAAGAIAVVDSPQLPNMDDDLGEDGLAALGHAWCAQSSQSPTLLNAVSWLICCFLICFAVNHLLNLPRA